MSNISFEKAVEALENKASGPEPRQGRTVTLFVTTWADTSAIEEITGLANHPNSKTGAVGVTGKGDGVIKKLQGGLTGAFNGVLEKDARKNGAKYAEELSDRTAELLLDLIGENGYVRRAVVEDRIVEPKRHSAFEQWELAHGVRHDVNPETAKYYDKCRKSVKDYIDRLETKQGELIHHQRWHEVSEIQFEIDRLKALLKK